MRAGDTARLMCPVTGAFCGLVRIVTYSDTLCTVWAETPILDWLTTGDDGSYPYQTWVAGHRFNVEAANLVATPSAHCVGGVA